MVATGGVIRLSCRECGAETYTAVSLLVGLCPECGGERDAEPLADRRSGRDRRGPRCIQHVWDYDPRSWFDRRQA
jgi:hypothetical protein